MKIDYRIMMLLALVLLLVNCTSDDRTVENATPEGDYVNGYFVLNEGGYTNNNASVSFVDETGTVYNNIFNSVNATALGDVAQNMGFYNDKAFVVVNYSNTIQVVNRYTFELITTIETDILNPRYITFLNNKAYVTNWGDPSNTTDDYVAVINLETYTVDKKIAVSEGPEKIVTHNNTIYVAQKGGWGFGNSISVIKDDALASTISVHDVPSGMVINDDKLFVLCSGKADWTGDETTAALYQVDTNNDEVQDSFQFSNGVHPSFLELANSQLYYTISGSVYTINVNTLEAPQDALFSTDSEGVEVLYGFKVTNDKIYIADAKNYTSNGEVFIYDLQGNVLQNYTVQIIPNGFYFNN